MDSIAIQDGQLIRKQEGKWVTLSGGRKVKISPPRGGRPEAGLPTEGSIRDFLNDESTGEGVMERYYTDSVESEAAPDMSIVEDAVKGIAPGLSRESGGYGEYDNLLGLMAKVMKKVAEEWTNEAGKESR